MPGRQVPITRRVALAGTWASAMSGCVTTSSRPRPTGVWSGLKPVAATSLSATAPVRDESGDAYSVVGLTAATPEQVLACARSVCEPAYGPMRYAREELPDGRTLHRMLSPRFDAGLFGINYRWLEASTERDVLTGKSIAVVREMYHWWKPYAFSTHGGLWPFPSWGDVPNKTEKEKQVLLAVMQRLGDPTAVVTDFGKLPR